MDTLMSMPRFETDAARREAVRARDREADVAFVFAVVTTGVYCRPSCAARPARPENLRFFDDRAAAERQGYRACQRCRPDLKPKAEREAAIVARACRMIEAAEATASLDVLAAACGLSPAHFHRMFRRIAGVTPRAYAAAHRAQKVQDGLVRGESVTAAFHGAGFGSSGRFYAAADGVLGMQPGAYRAGGKGELIEYGFATASLGDVLVAATAIGVCAILLGEDRATLAADLRRRFPNAVLTEAAHPWLQAAVDVVDGASADDLPLDIRGTAFQRRVWEALREIPRGQTASYGEVAAYLGAARSVRAVASACAANAVAVAVPCHRVVGKDGALTGYRWGVARKRALLARERA